MRSRLGYCVIWFCTTAVTQTCRAEYKSNFDFSMSTMQGAVSGFVQTPAGGQIGSSNSQRPTFDELNIPELVQNSANLSYRDGLNRYHLGLNLLAMSGLGTLKQDLTSQNTQFASGSKLKSKIRFDWLQLGYERSFATSLPNLSYTLGAELVLMRFDNQIRAVGDPLNKQVNRSYQKGGYRLGGTLGYQLNREIKLKFSSYVPLAIGSSVDITTAELIAEYQTQASPLSFFAGVSATRIKFQDSQTFPNSLKLKANTMFKAGVSYSLGGF